MSCPLSEQGSRQLANDQIPLIDFHRDITLDRLTASSIPLLHRQPVGNLTEMVFGFRSEMRLSEAGQGTRGSVREPTKLAMTSEKAVSRGIGRLPTKRDLTSFKSNEDGGRNHPDSTVAIPLGDDRSGTRP